MHRPAKMQGVVVVVVVMREAQGEEISKIAPLLDLLCLSSRTNFPRIFSQVVCRKDPNFKHSLEARQS